MKLHRPNLTLLLVAIFVITVLVQSSSSATVPKISRAKAYERFHDVLHPLQHEALPQKNFAEIRRMSGELVKRGKVIVSLGVQQAPRTKRAEFAKELRTFARALTTFKADVRKGDDAQLEKSFTAVHDSYEKLDALSVIVVHTDPGSVYLICSYPQPDRVIIVTAYAYAPLSADPIYRWKLEKGRIIEGANTAKIKIDTTGIPGEAISVGVEVDDRHGHLMYNSTSCKLAQPNASNP